MLYTLLTFTLLFGAVISLSIDDINIFDELNLSDSFENFRTLFNKEYSSKVELEYRYEVFKTNVKSFKLHNQQGKSYQHDINQFSDMTSEELKNKLFMRNLGAAPQFESSRYAPIQHANDLPSNWDWRNSTTPVVTPVRDQGSVGDCWAFSTIENVEGVWALKGNPLTVLSPEQLVDCDSQHDAHHANCGVFGGWPYLSFQHIIQVGGLSSEADYPYCSGTGNCYPCMAPGTSNAQCGDGPLYCNQTQNQCTGVPFTAHISDWKAISNDTNQIAAALIQYGPLSILLNADGLPYYSGGIYNPSYCDATDLDHAVLIVGYAPDYWIVKNSWGASWGIEGYFFIKRGANVCGVESSAVTAIV